MVRVRLRAVGVYIVSWGLVWLSAVAGAQQGEGEGEAQRPPIFGNVQNVALLNSWGNDSMPSVTSDGKHLFFASRRFPVGNDWDIWSSQRSGGIWQTPEILPEAINSGYETADPEVSPDGNRVFFTVKDHPLGYGGSDIWASQRVGVNWIPMVNLGPLVNTAEDETGPSSNEEGTELYFSRSLLGLGGDIFVVRWFNDVWQPAEPVAAVNTLDNECSPQIAEHGQMLYFVRGTLVKQLMVSRRVNDEWQPPEPVIIEGVTNPADPFVTADGDQIYFADRLSLLSSVFGNGTQDVYMATRQGAHPRAVITIPGDGARLAGDFITVSAELIVGKPSDASAVLFQVQPLGIANVPLEDAWSDLVPINIAAAQNPVFTPPYRTFFSGCDFPEGRLALRAVTLTATSGQDPAPEYIVVYIDRSNTEEMEGRPCFDLSNTLVSTLLHRKIAAAYAGRQNVIGLARPNYKLMVNVILDNGALDKNTLFYMAFHDPGSWDPNSVNPIQIAQNFTATVELFYPDSDDDGIIDGTAVAENELKLRVFLNGAWREVDSSRFIINTVQNKVVIKVGPEDKQASQTLPDKLTAIEVYSDAKGSVSGEVEVSKSLGGAMISCNLRDGSSSAAIEDGAVSIIPSVVSPVTENEGGVYTLFVPEGSYTVTAEAPSHDNGAKGVTVTSMQMKSVTFYLQPIVPEGEGAEEGEGTAEGSVEGVGEGQLEGAAEGQSEGSGEGQTEGVLEGEGTPDGEPLPHSTDINGDGKFSLGEILRAIQFFNMGGFYCASPLDSSEDGYMPGTGEDHACRPHDADYAPRDWRFSLGELLRIIQFFNMGGYHVCSGTEDGFCPGM